MLFDKGILPFHPILGNKFMNMNQTRTARPDDIRIVEHFDLFEFFTNLNDSILYPITYWPVFQRTLS